MMTANVASATNSLSSAKLGVTEDRNPLRSLARAGGALLRAELFNSTSYVGQAVKIAARNFAGFENPARSEAVKALHAA